MRRLHNIVLVITTFPFMAFGQQGATPADSTLKNILLHEVVVVREEGVAASNQREQRGSLQLSTDKLLERIPGVQLVRRGNYAWEPTLRSLNAGQINVTIDGMHLFGACTDRMDPVSSYIEPNNLSRVITHFGPDFGNHGGSIGGGIDFKLSEAAPGGAQRLSGMLGTGYETNARAARTLGSLHYSGKRFALDANAIFRKSANYRAADGAEVLFSQYQKWNGALSTKYQLNHAHAISASYIRDEGRDIGYPALTMDVAFANASIASFTHHYHQPEGKLAHLKTKVYYNFIDHAMDDTKRPPEQVPMHMDMPGKSWTGGFYSEAMILPGGDHVLNARISGYRNRLTADMTMYPEDGAPMYMYTIPDAQRTFLGLDLSDNIQMSDRLQLAVNGTLSYNASSIYSASGKAQLSGMAADDTDREDVLWNAGFKTVYRISPSWQVSADVARAARTASLQEYYAFYIFNRLDGFDYLGNTQLATEKSLNTSLGVTFHQGMLRVEATGFGYFFSDYIAGRILPEYSVMTIGANGVKQYRNIGNATLYGGELALGLTFSEGLRFSSINAYTRGEDGNGYALPLIAPFQSTNTVHARIRGYHFHADVETAAAQRHVSNERYGETSTPASTVVNLGVRKAYRVGGVMLTAAFEVENLFNEYYYRHLDIMKIARPGRNFVMNVTVGF